MIASIIKYRNGQLYRRPKLSIIFSAILESINDREEKIHHTKASVPKNRNQVKPFQDRNYLEILLMAPILNPS